MDLGEVKYAIEEGGCVGTFKTFSVIPLSPQKVVKQLYKLGSEPSFFNLDDNGKELP